MSSAIFNFNGIFYFYSKILPLTESQYVDFNLSAVGVTNGRFELM